MMISRDGGENALKRALFDIDDEYTGKKLHCLERGEVITSW